MISFYRSLVFTRLAIVPFCSPLHCHDIDISLYVIADRRTVSSDEDFFKKVEASVKGGATCIQWRDFEAKHEAAIEMISRLQELTRIHGVSLIINSRLEEALGVDGVFLERGTYENAREVLGQEIALSMPIETVEEALVANGMDLHHISVKVFSSTCTSTDLTPVSLEGLRMIRNVYHGRIVAVGGITLENAEDVLRELHPGDGIALRGELWRGNNTYETAKKLRTLVDRRFNRE